MDNTLIWMKIHKWYKKHGFLAAAADLKEIIREWRGNEQSLLNLLKEHKSWK